MSSDARIDGLEWMELLSASEIAKVLLVIEKYNAERVSLGDERAEINLKLALNKYIPE